MNFAPFAYYNQQKTETIFNIGTGFNGDVIDINFDDSNRIYVVGDFTSYNGTSRNRIIRLFEDGSIDTSFNIGTGFNGAVRNIGLSGTGNNVKLYITGDFTSYSGATRNRIISLNSDGSINSTFNVGTGLNNLGLTLFVDSSDKILVGGVFTQYNGTTRTGLVRLNTNGSIDTSFLNRTINPVVVRSIRQCSYGYHIVGDFTTWNSVANTAGSVIVDSTNSTTRSTDGDYNATNLTVVLENVVFSGNTSMIVGGFTGVTGGSTERIAYRYPSGTGISRTTIGAENNFAQTITTINKGSGNYDIFVGGDFTNGSNVKIFKYNLSNSGTLTLDTTFDPITNNSGYTMNNAIFRARVFNNKLYIGGSFTGNFNRIAAMNITTGKYLTQ